VVEDEEQASFEPYGTSPTVWNNNSRHKKNHNPSVVGRFEEKAGIWAEK
jgi:hypothetical protein